MIIRKIISIDTSADAENISHYAAGTVVRGQYEVKDISFKRDGYGGINKDCKDEAHYLIRLINELNKDDVIFIIIPKAEAKKITFKEIEVETKGEELKLERV